MCLNNNTLTARFMWVKLWPLHRNVSTFHQTQGDSWISSALLQSWNRTQWKMLSHCLTNAQIVDELQGILLLPMHMQKWRVSISYWHVDITAVARHKHSAPAFSSESFSQRRNWTTRAAMRIFTFLTSRKFESKAWNLESTVVNSHSSSNDGALKR